MPHVPSFEEIVAGKHFQMRPLTQDEFKIVFRPYGEALGFLVYIWNRLHDNLYQLFEAVLQCDPAVTQAIWYSTDSDFAQRKMLHAATKKAGHLSKRARESILWILDRIDDRLRHDRNNALHSPLSFLHSTDGDAHTMWVESSIWSASPRAKSLRGKDLLKEFKEYSDFADALSIYADRLQAHIPLHNPPSWPERPQLPHAPRKKGPKGSSRQSSAKRPPHPPEPSQE